MSKELKGIEELIDTHMHYLRLELTSINEHLKVLNARTGKNESSISRIKGIGIGVTGLCAVVALILKICGLY